MKIAFAQVALQNSLAMLALSVLSACGGSADSKNGQSQVQSLNEPMQAQAEIKTADLTSLPVSAPPPPVALPAPWKAIAASEWLEYEVNDVLSDLKTVPQVLNKGPAHYENYGSHVEMFNLSGSASNRVEIRTFPNYSSGYRAFDGWFLVESGTDNETIMQIFGTSASNATTAMFRVYDKDGGTLSYYDGQVLTTGIYGKWTRLTITHDANGNGTVTASVNGHLAGEWQEKGTSEHWMKYGTYGSHDDAHPAKVYWANVRLYQH